MATPCPCETCEQAYDCDACLDAHLRAEHGATYAGAFGSVPEGWLGFCSRHTRVPVSRMGGVEPVTPPAAQAA